MKIINNDKPFLTIDTTHSLEFVHQITNLTKSLIDKVKKGAQQFDKNLHLFHNWWSQNKT